MHDQTGGYWQDVAQAAEYLRARIPANPQIGFMTGTGLGGGGGTRPSVVEGTTLTARDYPRRLRRAWPRGGRVLVAVRVQVNGRATDCRVNVSIGVPEIDAETCRLVEEKVRFNPARDARGNPYVAWYGYMQYNPG